MPVEKGPEPHALTVWREAGNVGWDVPGDVKDDIRHGLWAEQSGLCAFCCAKLPPNPLLQRIAHVEPCKRRPERALDYSNMVASCSSGVDKMPDGAMIPREKSCDESQGSREPPIHPLQADCATKFAYLGNGAIRPAAGAVGSQETITILNLDCDRLRRGRMGAIRGALLMKERLEPEDWDRIYRNPRPPYGREFWPAIASLP